jgi:hypothetical protein
MTNTMNHLDRIFELADARNVEAAHMLITFDASDTELADAIRAFGVDHITDSVIDDILAELDGDEDNHEECDHAHHYCVMVDFNDEGTV